MIPFLCAYFKNGAWIEEIFYYKVDLNSIDLSNDWRFKKIPNKRNQLIPLI